MSELNVDDFDAYFSDLHGDKVEPFPWQRRLLQRIVATGCWPELLDLPTGAGKTTALDIAVFALALDASRAPSERTAPRRTVLVVDRRTVVDQAYARARHIARALVAPTSKLLQEVAARLTSLSSEAESNESHIALSAHVLRGGIPRDNDWAQSPTRPLLAVSTVDQVGSRLLFRGYGMSPGMQPIHAGMLGNDVLFLLDEVHLARPFRDLLEQLKLQYRSFKANGLPDRWQVVQMSATSGERNETAFALAQDDIVHPKLAPRLNAHKATRLHEVKVGGSETKRKQMLANAIAESAIASLAPARAIGIVVNRVDTARRVFDALRPEIKKRGGECWLVTGRMRPGDRMDVESQLRDAAGSDRDRALPGMRVVVATQCIEAGADFDFDVLLTECASLDALRQRFGRLNRLGRVETAEGGIFAREDQIKDGAEQDPIYGEALKNTWDYLRSLGTVDFGIRAFELPNVESLKPLLVQSRPAPFLLPSHLDAWVQTSPSPLADPEPGLWLHGKQDADRDVTVVWRADIDEATLREATGTGSIDKEPVRADALDGILSRLELCPPCSMEGLSVPIRACRAWLRQEAVVDITDAGWLVPNDDREASRAQERPVLCWRGDKSKVISSKDLTPWSRAVNPGDTLVVPSTYGGLRDSNWDPESKEPVSDLGDRAQWVQRGRGVLRLHEGVLASVCSLDILASILPVPHQTEDDDAELDDTERVKVWLSATRAKLPTGWLKSLVEAFEGLPRSKLRLVPCEMPDSEKRVQQRAKPPTAGPWLFVTSKTLRCANANDRFELETSLVDATTDDDYASLTGAEVTLSSHLAGVEAYVRSFATNCGLPDRLVAAMALAGRWHDAGKADPRFQRWLHGGSAFKAEVASEPLAKSALSSQNRSARKRARAQSGYPRGARHELLSVALMQHAPELAEHVIDDWELVLHLVGSHHGHCRPFAPFVPDQNPVDVVATVDGVIVSHNSAHGLERLDSGVADRFWCLVHRYGWYGLAWLEAIFRLADHRRSEHEARQMMSSDGKEQRNGL